MPNNVDGRAVTVSVRIYERLLAMYPAAFRREYAPAMKQLFRDQCRDAWNESRSWGLAVLWLRALTDLAKTSVAEHLSSLNQRESLFMKMMRVIRTDPRFRSTFIRVLTISVVGAFVCRALVTLWSPVYPGTVVIEVQKDATEVSGNPYFLITQYNLIESYSILTNVIAKLHLNERLPEQLGKPRWTVDETFRYLSKMIIVEDPRPTSLIKFTVKNPNPQFAADIANAIAASYLHMRMGMWHDMHPYPDSDEKPSPLVRIRVPAKAELNPIAPNWRTFQTWMFGGTLLALSVAGWLTISNWRIFRRQRAH